MTARGSRLVLAVAVALGLCSPVHAGDDEPEPGDRKKAEQYFRMAEKAFRAQSYGAAAESFELAFKELPLPEIAYSAAQAYRRHYYVEQNPAHAKRAVELYRSYLDKVKTGGRVGDASDALAEMQREVDRHGGAKIATVDPRSQATRLAVSYVIEGEKQTAMTELGAMSLGASSVDTLDAKAMLDGKPVELHAPIDVTAGNHTAEIVAPGYFPDKRSKLVLEGAKETIELVLRPRPAKLRIVTEAGASIAIDGRPASTTSALAAGKHLVAITRRGRDPVQREVVVGRGEERDLKVDLSFTAKRRAVPWVFAGAGGAAVVAGITAIVAIRADGRMQDLATQRETVGITAAEHAEYQREVTRRDRFRDATYVIGAVSVATAAVGLSLYYFDRPTVPAVSADRVVVPTATSSSVGASVIGRF